MAGDKVGLVYSFNSLFEMRVAPGTVGGLGLKPFNSLFEMPGLLNSARLSASCRLSILYLRCKS